MLVGRLCNKYLVGPLRIDDSSSFTILSILRCYEYTAISTIARNIYDSPKYRFRTPIYVGFGPDLDLNLKYKYIRIH